MKRLSLLYITSVILVFSACDSVSDKAKSEEGNTESSACPLTLVDSTVNVKWTAFKTTERIGVSGTFDIVSVSGAKTGETPSSVLENASFEIPVSSVNSANPDRDKKIFGHFFSTMENTSLLAGKVLSTGSDKWKLGFVMNGVRDTLELDFKREGDAVSLSGVMELSEWNALASVDSLNQVCYDLHKGADGVSKLWPDVKIDISANMAPKCD